MDQGQGEAERRGEKEVDEKHKEISMKNNRLRLRCKALSQVGVWLNQHLNQERLAKDHVIRPEELHTQSVRPRNERIDDIFIASPHMSGGGERDVV